MWSSLQIRKIKPKKDKPKEYPNSNEMILSFSAGLDLHG